MLCPFGIKQQLAEAEVVGLLVIVDKAQRQAASSHSIVGEQCKAHTI
jgi:hypothetical protein